MRLMEEAYKGTGDRAANVDGWTHLPEYDSEYTAVYKNSTGDISVSVRGSKTKKDWLFHDPLILLRNKPGEKQTESIQQFLIQVAREYSNTELTVNAHSLSGSFIMNAFQDANEYEKQWPNRYRRINMFNPGSSPLKNTNQMSDFAKDPRVYLYLNKTDFISNTFATQLPKDFDRVTYGEASRNLVASHTMVQWTGKREGN